MGREISQGSVENFRQTDADTILAINLRENQ